MREQTITSGKMPSPLPRTKKRVPTLLARYLSLSSFHPYHSSSTPPLQSKSAPKARAKKEDKVYLEIEARFDRPDRGGRGRGRGDRGGEHRGDRGRSTRSRGGPRGGRQNGSSAPLVNVDDQTDFPTLS